jgi:osmotically-inducible protein OsmY
MFKNHSKTVLIAALIVGSPLVGSAETTTAPDNSAVNSRVEKNNELTAQDQASATASETELTRKIRQNIVHESDFSVYAKNVKIIVADQTVTLKGPVNTAREKMRIAQIAKATVGNADYKINNELDVKK